MPVTRSMAKSICEKGFNNSSEVRITRNVYLDRVLIVEKRAVVRRQSCDESKSQNGPNFQNQPLKSILKKPKPSNPFGVYGRRKSMGSIREVRFGSVSAPVHSQDFNSNRSNPIPTAIESHSSNTTARSSFAPLSSASNTNINNAIGNNPIPAAIGSHSSDTTARSSFAPLPSASNSNINNGILSTVAPSIIVRNLISELLKEYDQIIQK